MWVLLRWGDYIGALLEGTYVWILLQGIYTWALLGGNPVGTAE